MLDKSVLVKNIKELVSRYEGLSSAYKKAAAEPKAEEETFEERSRLLQQDRRYLCREAEAESRVLL